MTVLLVAGVLCGLVAFSAMLVFAMMIDAIMSPIETARDMADGVAVFTDLPALLVNILNGADRD